MKRIDDIRELHDEICEAYLKDPNFCPYCEADEIDAERVDVEGRVAWQWVRCDTCGAESWLPDARASSGLAFPLARTSASI